MTDAVCGQEKEGNSIVSEGSSLCLVTTDRARLCMEAKAGAFAYVA